LATKVAIDEGPTSSAGFGAFSPCRAREAEDLLDDVAHVHGGGRRAARLDLGAQVAQVFRPDLGHQPIAERRQDVPVDDALAHRLRALGHPGFFQPALRELFEGLGLGRPALFALLLLGGRPAFGDRLARFHAALARHQQARSQSLDP
jgi:hypothetical protein